MRLAVDAEGVRVHWVNDGTKEALEASDALDTVEELLQLLFASMLNIVVAGLHVIPAPAPAFKDWKGFAPPPHGIRLEKQGFQ